MCILLGILEIALKHYFYLVEREDKKEAAKQAIWKINQLIEYFSKKGRKFQSKIVETKKRTHEMLKQILKIVYKLNANSQNYRNLAPASEQIIGTTNMAQFSVGFSKTEGADFQLAHSVRNLK